MMNITVSTIVLFLFIVSVFPFSPVFRKNRGLSVSILRDTISQSHAARHKLNSVSADDKTLEQAQKKPYSFVQDDLRKYAMKLHTRSQSSMGQAKEPQKPQTPYETTRQDYQNFLVDSQHVYETLEQLVGEYDDLSSLRQTGLERSEALKKDITWMAKHDSSVTIPECGKFGLEYSAYLKELAETNIPRFICHYYNHYFAHTAGGMMIGKQISAKLLGGEVLEFYKWNEDVRQLLDQTRTCVDEIASKWSEQQKQECMEETPNSFKYSGSLMNYMKGIHN